MEQPRRQPATPPERDHQPPEIAPSQTRDEVVLRVGLVALLVVLTFQVVQPFVVPLLWAVIIAVSLYPVYARIRAALGGRRAYAAALSTVITLVALTVPFVYLADTLVTSVEPLAARVAKGEINIPPPPAGVGDLPMIGNVVEKYWTEAANDDGAFRARLLRHLKPLAAWLASGAAGLTLAIAQFIAAILVAGVLMARAPEMLEWTHRVVLRLAPSNGATLMQLAGATIRNVSRGVLGVALIQSLCAGVAFLLAGIPAAGLWALLCFVFASIQIGVLPVVGPVAVYALFTMDLTVAIPLALWCGFVGLIDNILKPLLLHHGMDTPLWVFVVGSIGGLISSGFIGLFIGPVLLVLAYEVGREWLNRDTREAEPT